MGAKAADIGRELLRQHGNGAIWEVDAGSAQTCFQIEIRSGALATRGGLRVNAKAEVLSALTGEPIPGLYAAGNSSNCATPWSYPGAGSTIGAGMTYAYLAAQEILAKTRQAVAVKPGEDELLFNSDARVSLIHERRTGDVSVRSISRNCVKGSFSKRRTP